MAQEERQLLLADLCSRLPYQPKLQIYYEEMSGSGVFDEELWEIDGDGQYCNGGRRLEDIKPYLRSMSSMTEEEKEELKEISRNYLDEWENAKTPIDKWKLDAKISYNRSIFYNSHHLDWNGLIELGLALEAPEGMYN